MFPHVSTEALVCAVVLSEEGNLGRTAERLHTSNTNVGRKVKILQKGWGIVFFRRTMTGFELTEEGRSAMREVRMSLEYVQRAFDRAIYVTVKNRSPLRIGHSLYIHGKVLPFLEKQTASGLDFSRIALKADTTLQSAEARASWRTKGDQAKLRSMVQYPQPDLFDSGASSL